MSEQRAEVVDGDGAVTPDLAVGLQSERIPATTWVDAYYWSCQVCGWLGTGFGDIDTAQRVAGDHFRDEHEQREVYIVRKDLR